MSTGQSDDDRIGRLLAGRYRVTAQLGRGGMGVVCRAVDEVLGREVAVKELRTFSDASAEELASLRLRMQREARAAARIRHPGVIAVHDVAEEHGRPIIVMELVDGLSLDDVLAERGVLDPREAAAIGAKVVDALGAAHRVGVLHRDVKPGNVLLERGGRVVLTDFGIAAMDDPGDGSAANLTQSGELVGSLDFLAPERAQGQLPGPASDVWSLGAMLYATVEGSSPFRRTSAWSTMTAIVSEPLPEPQRAGPLTPVLRQLMAKDPAARPDAERARQLLEAVAAGRSAAPATPGAFGPPPVVDSRTMALGAHRAAAPSPAGPDALATRAEPVRPGPAAETAASGGSGRRGRVLLTAAVTAVVLAGAAVTVALVDHSGAQNAGRGASGAGSGPPGVSADPGAGGTAARGTGTNGTTPLPDSPPTAGRHPRPGTPTAGPTGPAAGGGGTPTATAPGASCHAATAGKYDCDVWKTATSYDAGHRAVGTLHAGANYFFCQANLGVRETDGQWTNIWWAKTDDDSGNSNVYISDVYLKGGADDAPVPGLPTC